MTTIKSNFRDLKLRLELASGKDYGMYDHLGPVSPASRSPRCIAFTTAKRSALSSRLLAALLDFFAAEGMPVTIDDLFVTEPD